MRTFLRFLKPYRGLCLLTLLVMALDVAGALYLPTIVADMINICAPRTTRGRGRG